MRTRVYMFNRLICFLVYVLTPQSSKALSLNSGRGLLTGCWLGIIEGLSTNQVHRVPLDTRVMSIVLPPSSSLLHIHLETRPTQRPFWILEMTDLPHRCYGNLPQRRAAPSPQATLSRLKPRSPETGPILETSGEEENISEEPQVDRGGVYEMENGTYQLGKRQRCPEKNLETLLKQIRIHPEAQRILGNSSVAVVRLERLNFQYMSLSSLQPVVCLVRLQDREAEESGSEAQQNGWSQSEVDLVESCDLSTSEATPTSWTEPFCPEEPAEEPEQDSGFDCESNPDRPYILLDPNEWDAGGKPDSDTFYLDPDPEQTLVIQVDPEPESDQDRYLVLEDESSCEVDLAQKDEAEDEGRRRSEDGSSGPHPESRSGMVEVESEDFCAVCLNGGDLLCCDRCPKVYHLACHIPPLVDFPLGDWLCTLCRPDQDSGDMYDCESFHSSGGSRALYTLSNQDQRRCEKLTLLLYSHLLSAPFHDPVSPLARNYYQIIRRPIDLSVIRRKLNKNNTLHYFTAEQFVDDVLLMFKNCSTFNYPDSEVAQAGRNLELFFLNKLKEVFPERSFPLATQDRTDRARLQWTNRKRKDGGRRRRCVFTGKKYYL